MELYQHKVEENAERPPENRKLHRHSGRLFYTKLITEGIQYFLFQDLLMKSDKGICADDNLNLLTD